MKLPIFKIKRLTWLYQNEHCFMPHFWISDGVWRYSEAPLIHPVVGMLFYLVIYVGLYFRYWPMLVTSFAFKSGLGCYFDSTTYTDFTAYTGIFMAFVWPFIFLAATFTFSSVAKDKSPYAWPQRGNAPPQIRGGVNTTAGKELYSPLTALLPMPSARKQSSLILILLVFIIPALTTFYISASKTNFNCTHDNLLNFYNIYTAVYSNKYPTYAIIALMFPAAWFYMVYLGIIFPRIPAPIFKYIQQNIWNIY